MTNCSRNKRRVHWNHRFDVSRNSIFFCLQAFVTPACNTVWEEFRKFLGFSVYPRVYFISNCKAHTEILSRQAPFQLISGSYNLKSFFRIYYLCTFFFEIGNLGLLTYLISSSITLLFIVNMYLRDFWSVSFTNFHFRRSFQSWRESESSSAFQISCFYFSLWCSSPTVDLFQVCR